MAGAARPYNPRMENASQSAVPRGLLGLSPASCLRGELRPPGSKSEAQRVLLTAAVCAGATVVEGLPHGEDVGACLQLVEDSGVTVYRTTPGRVLVEGRPPRWDGGLHPPGPVQVGESGTLARLATALLALCGTPGTPMAIHARGSLLLRRSPALFRALTGAGVEITRQNLEGGWPVILVARRPPKRLVLEKPGSSQEVSALLLVAAAQDAGLEVRVRGPIPSRPYVTLTRHVLSRFGVEVDKERGLDGEVVFRVRGPLRAPRETMAVEPDASGAAVALAGACLSGGDLRIPGLTSASLQGDVRIVEHLAAFGCQAESEATGLRARGFPTRGADLDLAGEPDLAPPLAAVAAGAALRHGATSTLCGLGTLPGKESDRIAVLAAGLERLGFEVVAGEDFLTVGPRTAEPKGRFALDPYDDHRMAFAFALLGLLLPGVLVRHPRCVAKSWADFWKDMERAGAVLETDLAAGE